MRRGQAGTNPHQSASVDENRERRVSRAGRRVRVEGDQAATAAYNVVTPFPNVRGAQFRNVDNLGGARYAPFNRPSR
jgi:hypothetical protein